jgi:glycosyltransferase involved in cell wall biosynthesis
VWEYAKELNRVGHEVAVIGHEDSVFPTGVSLLPAPAGEEIRAFQAWHYRIREFDVIHDFSHFHIASRFVSNLPSLNIFWHAPALQRYPKAPYNVIALSKWAEREFERCYGYKARYQQSIVVDCDKYKPKGKRGDRFLTIGRMAPEKGNINAILICRELGLPLDVAGGRGLENTGGLTPYEIEVRKFCDGEQIRFLGEVDEEEKLRLMRTCKGLIYCTDHPEVTSHKIQEALLCGAPVVAPRLGGIPEIVTHGVDGFLCSNEQEFIDGVRNIDSLEPSTTRKQLVDKYSVRSVVKRYVNLYEKVANGLRW